MNRRTFLRDTAIGAGVLCGVTPLLAAEKPEPLVIAVMDPLTIDLACSCIPGFAQRQYRVLAEHMQNDLNRPVSCVFSESLKSTFLKSPTGKIDLMIGMDDVVRHDAKYFKLEIDPVAKLTDLEGKTTHRGLFVVEKSDPAQKLADLKSHKIVFGPEYSRERRVEPIKMLEAAGITVPEKPFSVSSNKDAALEILENDDVSVPIAAILGDYSLKLMEGCKTVEKGSLRTVEKTPEVPFVAAFAVKTTGQDLVKKIRDALFSFGNDEKNLAAFESKTGFVSYDAISPTSR